MRLNISTDHKCQSRDIELYLGRAGESNSKVLPNASRATTTNDASCPTVMMVRSEELKKRIRTQVDGYECIENCWPHPTM